MMKMFDSSCTLPPDDGEFVSSPNVRGTLDIVWSCGAILLLCTWSTLHLNVPIQSDAKTRAQKLYRATSRFVTKVQWMLLALIMPEWPLAKAWSDYQAVSLLEDGLRKRAEEDGVPWSRTHTYFANMGGFGIRFSPESTEPALEKLERQDTDTPSRQLTTEKDGSPSASSHAAAGPARKGTAQLGALEANEEDAIPANVRYTIQLWEKRNVAAPSAIQEWIDRKTRRIGALEFKLDEANSAAVHDALGSLGLHLFHGASERQKFLSLYGSWMCNLRALQGSLWVLDASQLLMAREIGIIDKLPSVTKDDLDDRNKDDEFVKLLALSQIAWFILQLGARLATRQAITQLEVLVFAYSLCTGVSYLLLLDKPKEAQSRVYVQAARYGTASAVSRVALAGPGTCGPPRGTRYGVPNNGVHGVHGEYARPVGGRGSSSSGSSSSKGDNPSIRDGSALAVAVFGAAHCLAWDLSFPTTVERTLWRASALVTAALVPAAVVVTLFKDWLWVRVLRLPDRLVLRLPGRCGRSLRTTLSRRELSIIIWWLVGPVFVAARVFTLVEVVRSLASLPPGAFQATTWPSSLPHIS